MRKISIIIMLLLFLNLFSCSIGKKIENIELVNVIYTSNNLNDNIKCKYSIDFDKLIVEKCVYSMSELTSNSNNDFTTTQKEEFSKTFINNGLLDLYDEYIDDNLSEYSDSYEWNLEIVFTIDGVEKRKVSHGYNDCPYDEFISCKMIFDEICGDNALVISLSEEKLPSINLSTNSNFNNCKCTNNQYIQQVFKYNWNNQNLDLDLYDTAISTNSYFLNIVDYILILKTDSYASYDRFDHFSIYTYDCNNELTNECLEYEGEWFQSLEFELKLNKVYVLKICFDNGEYAYYTFNTITKGEFIYYSYYNYESYNCCISFLFKDNGEFIMIFTDNKDNKNNETLSGTYEYHYLIDKHYIILNFSNDNYIYLLIKQSSITISYVLSKFEFTKYQIENKNLPISFYFQKTM